MTTDHDDTELQPQDATGAAGDDLSAALGEAETTFVTSERTQQVSTGTLVVGGLIVAAAAVTYFMHLRTGPATAAAANPAAAGADATITQFLSSDTQNTERMRQLLKDTDKAVQQFKQQPAKTQVPLADLKTNPFRTEANANKSEAAERALEKRKKDELLQAAAALKIQSIMSGQRKAVMINNTPFAEGDTVQGFEIERINPDSVIVRKDGSRFALKMQK
jgi:hypothetical protein